jgi:hypothetical protein
MSRLTTGILGAIALSLVSGAAQLALGHDMGRDFAAMARDIAPTLNPSRDLSQSSQAKSSGPGSSMVNRMAKSDRAASQPGRSARTRTVLLRLNGFADTSFLLRIPVADRTSSPPRARPGVRNPTVACEPVVSVLTEVAKRLEPGRCVT